MTIKAQTGEPDAIPPNPPLAEHGRPQDRVTIELEPEERKALDHRIQTLGIPNCTPTRAGIVKAALIHYLTQTGSLR
jgi:hypothetical protein